MSVFKNSDVNSSVPMRARFRLPVVTTQRQTTGTCHGLSSDTVGPVCTIRRHFEGQCTGLLDET